MAKTKTKFKGVVKGAALGFALIMCSAFFPANAIANAADYTDQDTAQINTTRIQVNGQGKSFSVKRGASVSVPEGEYLYNNAGSQGKHTIGSAVSGSITKSEVKVTYKATGDEVEVDKGNFTAEKVGTYVITYTVVDNGMEYSYDQLVEVEASEASFEFKQNDKNVIPSIYDVSNANEKDIVLPLPTVNDEDGNEILTSDDDEYYILNKDTSKLPQDDLDNDFVAKKVYVNISITNGSNKVSIDEREVEGKKEFYISGETLSAMQNKKAELDGQEFKIFYSFYQKSENGDVFVNSTSKTFTVRTNYYYTSSEKETAGYDLVASFKGNKPDSAVVGIEKTLPSITATTGSKNTPSSEEVDAYYDLVVYKANADGNYNDNNDVTDKVITEDGKFKAVEEGSYKFVYKVGDFYHEPKELSTTTFVINKVKDTVSANVFVYDASNKNAYDSKNKTYESAEKLLKSQTVNRNIVMYAVGGTDNMVKRYEDLTPEEKENDAKYITLRRVIKDNSGIDRFVIDNKEFNSYNLIFAPGVASGETISVWKAIVEDNYQIRKQMLKESKDISNDDEIKAFLLDNNYRLVTTEFNKDINGNDIVEGLTENTEDALIQMLDKGYAYVKPETANYEFSEQTYSFYYYAKDNVNNNKESFVYFPVKLTAGFDDNSVPTLTFSSDLQSTYLANDKFDFKVATATDSIDSEIETVTAYRYLDADKKGIDASADEKASTLEYYVENANSSLMNKTTGKWYAQKGAHSHAGWYVAEDDVCEIDLSKKPAGAGYVEILAYAVDDYGNVGFFNKVIRIASTTDTVAPVLYKVLGAPESTMYTAPSEISLPTLYFDDANANYMHAQVSVYKLVKVDGKVTGKVLVQSSGMKTTYDTQRNYFKVNAGVFKASTEGDYQAVITVVDSGNHSVTSYFNYSAKAGAVSEEPTIDNISSDPIELEPGQGHYLVAPTFTMINNDKYGYVGIEEDDDAFTSTYYNVSVVSASSNDYELDESYFIGNSEGTYQLKYTAFLIQYSKDALVLEKDKADGKVFFDENGKLKFTKGSVDYFVYIDQEAENALTLNTALNGSGSSIDASAVNGIISRYVDESEVQVIKVSEVFMKVSIDDDAYATTKYEELGQKVEIVKPSFEFKGNGELNKEQSTVTITKTSSGTTQNVATLTLADWETKIDDTNTNFEVVGNKIYLILKNHGEYKIKYSLQAKTAGENGYNVGDPYTETFTIASGDTQKPTVEVKDSVVVKEKYNIGDKVVINMAGITVDDNITTDKNALLKKLTITYKNTTLNEKAKTLTNKATEEGKYIYEIDELKTAGNYVITFTVRDEAGNISSEQTVEFEVSTSTSDPASTKEVMGGILIAVSVVLLVGVVGYFVVSKVKLDKKEKSYKNAGKDKKNKE